MVGVAQLVERRTVAPNVVGSNPISHPTVFYSTDFHLIRSDGAEGSAKSIHEVRVKSIRCRGVLFDLDGVLVDSTPAVARVWAWWAHEHEFNADEVVRQAHGRPSIATIRELLPNGDHEAENREVERREIEDLLGVIPLPGALQLLGALPPDRWAIVTSCTRRL